MKTISYEDFIYSKYNRKYITSLVTKNPFLLKRILKDLSYQYKKYTDKEFERCTTPSEVKKELELGLI